jgi:hypothetical protein
METPTVHLITTTTAEAQDVIRSTVALVHRPDTRVIICISHDSGFRQEAPCWIPPFQFCLL